MVFKMNRLILVILSLVCAFAPIAEAAASPLAAAFSASAGVAAKEKVVNLEAKLEAMLETQRPEEVSEQGRDRSACRSRRS